MCVEMGIQIIIILQDTHTKHYVQLTYNLKEVGYVGCSHSKSIPNISMIQTNTFLIQFWIGQIFESLTGFISFNRILICTTARSFQYKLNHTNFRPLDSAGDHPGAACLTCEIWATSNIL